MGAGASSRTQFDDLSNLRGKSRCTCQACAGVGHRSGAKSRPCPHVVPQLPTDEAFTLSTALRVIERSDCKRQLPLATRTPLIEEKVFGRTPAKTLDATEAGTMQSPVFESSPLLHATKERALGFKREAAALATCRLYPRTVNDAITCVKKKAITPPAHRADRVHLRKGCETDIEEAALESYSRAQILSHIAILPHTGDNAAAGTVGNIVSTGPMSKPKTIARIGSTGL